MARNEPIYAVIIHLRNAQLTILEKVNDSLALAPSKIGNKELGNEVTDCMVDGLNFWLDSRSIVRHMAR